LLTGFTGKLFFPLPAFADLADTKGKEADDNGPTNDGGNYG
jgi:hypothetical protein